MKKPGKKKGRVFQIVNTLKQKVGSGGFDPVAIKRAQDYIEEHANNPELFEEMAVPILKDMKAICDKISSNEAVTVDEMTMPILDLKSNGQMFGYKPITAICSDILDVAQSTKVLNKDFEDLFVSLYEAIRVMLKNKMTDQNNKMVMCFDMELGRACSRYRKKYGLESRIFKK